MGTWNLFERERERGRPDIPQRLEPCLRGRPFVPDLRQHPVEHQLFQYYTTIYKLGRLEQPHDHERVSFDRNPWNIIFY